MKDVRIKLPKAHAKQIPIIKSKAKVKVLKCGRQSGKSTVAQIIALKAMIAGKSVAYICHKFDLSKKFFNSLLKSIPKELIKRDNSSSLSIELITGGVIQFYSGNATSTLRGSTFHLCICDEFAFWNNPEQSYNEDISVTLARYNGDMIVLSTPYGRNFFTELFDRGVDCQDGTIESFYFTCLDNPYLSAEFLQRKKDEVPDAVWKQEYLALETSNKDGIVTSDVIERNTIPELSDEESDLYGVDYATHRDWSVVIGINAKSGRMTHFQRFQKDPDETMRIISELPSDKLVVIDSTGAGDVIYMQLAKKLNNLKGYKFTTTSKPQLIKTLILSLERDELKFIPQVATEIGNYRYTFNASGYVSYEGKPFDDCVCALALANMFKESCQSYEFEDRFMIGG